MSNAIPTVPTQEINLSNDGLKNLAGWIARYIKLIKENKLFDLFHQDVAGDSLVELIQKKNLVKFDPTISEIRKISKSNNGDYEPYEFDLLYTGDNFSIEPNNNEVFVSIHFSFLGNNKVSVYTYIECCMERSEEHKHIRTSFLDQFLNSFGFSDFEINTKDENVLMEMSWLEADGLISAINSQPQIPELPA